MIKTIKMMTLVAAVTCTSAMASGYVGKLTFDKSIIIEDKEGICADLVFGLNSWGKGISNKCKIQDDVIMIKIDQKIINGKRSEEFYGSSIVAASELYAVTPNLKARLMLGNDPDGLGCILIDAESLYALNKLVKRNEDRSYAYYAIAKSKKYECPDFLK